MKLFTTLAVIAVALVGAVALNPVPAQAADYPNLLIMMQDADDDTVPRNSRVADRVMDALTNQLTDAGFRVFNETAVTLDDFAQDRIRRSDAELIDIARSIQRPPIDVVVLYEIFASAQERGYTTKVRARVVGRMLDVQTGERLGNFELEAPRGDWNVNPKCNRECILEAVGKNTRILANDIGAVLSEQLAWQGRDRGGYPGGPGGGDGRATQYVLEFDNFTPDDVMAIEEYLVIFSGYDSHRPISSGARRAEFWYQSSITTAKLNRNLNRMLAELDLRGVVRFNGNTFTISRIMQRRDRPAPSGSDW